MRLHRNLTFSVIDSIRDIFNEGVYADKAVEKALKRDKRWGARDRKFVAETIYDIVRWNRLYAEIADVKVPYDRDNIWRLFSVWCILRGIALPDWNQIGDVPKEKSKAVLPNCQKSENTENPFQIGWMRCVWLNWAKSFGPRKLLH